MARRRPEQLSLMVPASGAQGEPGEAAARAGVEGSPEASKPPTRLGKTRRQAKTPEPIDDPLPQFRVPASVAAEAAEPEIATVTQIVQLASRHLEGHFGKVWVEGEVSNLRQPASGHAYFTLKDAGAQLAVVLFRSSARRLRARLEDGQIYRVYGRLTIYEAQGRFQLVAERVEVTGIGRILAAVEALKRKLAAEGLFAEEHKLPLPALPRRIAVVTSRTGAALRDILRILGDRWPVDVVVCPAPVQGQEAPREIVAALRRAEALGVDLIIVGRGGGSLEDLQAFNDEAVARTIFGLRTPTISAVGHEIDTLISDLVADRRAATPTAAAEIAVPPRRELEARFDQLRERLRRAMARRLEQATFRLDRARRDVVSPERLIERRRQHLDDRVSALRHEREGHLRVRRERFARVRMRLETQRPTARLARDGARLDALVARAGAAMRRKLEGRRGEISRLTAALDALSPLAVLGRGYSIVTDEAGHVLRDVRETREGALLGLRLARGRLLARVETVDSSLGRTESTSSAEEV